MEIGFYSHVNVVPNATRACLESVRKFYPDAPIVLSCDNGYDFSEMAGKYNTLYHHNSNVALGYPVQPYGYKKKNALEWLDRMYRGVSLLDTEYYCMLEDDVLLVSNITIDKNWQMAGHPFLFEDQVPRMPEVLMTAIEKFSGKRPSTDTYNCGGGSIFKTSTFVDNYSRVREFLDENFNFIQNYVYPTIGWMDCLMCTYFYLCGADQVENKRLYNILPRMIPFNFVYPEGTEIIHNFKDYY